MRSVQTVLPHCYVVGGYVRDGLLGIPQGDRDFIVCESDTQTMLAKGFMQVGKSFAVFLHPQTKEEYALARLESKVKPGHRGFVTSIKGVSLQQDLLRRDLTINAMAMDAFGKIIDPYGGYRDLQGRILRHVSPAFSEDPLRVLRVARFAAQLAPLGFRVSSATLQMMATISASGELQSLSGERVWQETAKALSTERPSIYFQTLHQCGALIVLFPEIAKLFGVPQTPCYHPEIDSGIHTMMVVDMAAKMQCSVSERFAALVHDVGKGITPSHELPSHRGHEKRGVPLVEKMCQRLRTSSRVRKFAIDCTALHLHCHRAMELKPSTMCNLITRLDGWRNPHNISAFTRVCKADARGRLHFDDCAYPQATYIQQCYVSARSIAVQKVIEGIHDNAKKSLAIRRARIHAIKKVQKPTYIASKK